MNRRLLIGGVSLLLCCGAGPVAMAAEDAVEAPRQLMQTSQTVRGRVLLKTQDKQSQIAYLRLQDDAERVWLVVLAPQTKVTREDAPVAMSEVKEGVYVEAYFQKPQGENDPVLETLKLLPGPSAKKAE